MDENQLNDIGIDKLTGLLSIEQFYIEAQKMLDTTISEEPYYIIYFNVSNFSLYNVRCSVENGNWVLKNLAGMVNKEFHNGVVGRYSEDHFIVLTCSRHLIEHITKIVQDFNIAYAREGLELKIGVCRLEDCFLDIPLAYSYAKIACESIKNEFNRFYCFYDETIEQKIAIQEYVTLNLDNAIEKKYIKLYFQPIFRTLTNDLCEFEVLARWDDPEKGFLSPADFIATLEDNHQIYKLDIYMVNEACRLMREQMDQGNAVVPVSLNISRIDLLTCDIYAEIEKATSTYQIPRSMIHIEITESALLRDIKRVLDTTDHLRNSGYHVWMDDFGDGYSTLNLLDRCEFDLVKLDMGFLRIFNEKSKKIIENVVRMAKQLGLQTLAEGVETKEQYEFLRNIGCERVQGYYFGKPMPLCDILDFLEAEHKETETRELAAYYDKIGLLEYTTDRPLAVYELIGDKVNLLYWNPYYLDVFISTGLHNLDEVIQILNDKKSSLSTHFRNFLQQITYMEQVYNFDYTVRDYYIRLNIRKIAATGERAAYRIENANLTNERDALRNGRNDYINHIPRTVSGCGVYG